MASTTSYIIVRAQRILNAESSLELRRVALKQLSIHDLDVIVANFIGIRLWEENSLFRYDLSAKIFQKLQKLESNWLLIADLLYKR